ncbi:hypothetical protein MLD38_023218 [Melastoma candidum]|uniref:Uncharacterized protein n=1 Tax=Melastoma candidum TaxID=119954 RepID=A0ACB9QLZ7_9MYRT|nr:hypothetical protein MLD38_023218 [Melastoma candidum]
MATVAPALPGRVDLASLSQSDLLSLSAATAPAEAPHEFVVPVIDRSIFNESAGSRRQTYSRPATSVSPSATSPVAAAGHHRNRVPALKPHQPPTSSSQDPLTADNASIITHLKYLLSQNPNFTDVILSRPLVAVPESSVGSEFSHGRDDVSGVLGFKRKRGRKPRARPSDHVSEYYSVRESQVGSEMEIVNRDGNVVDVDALEKEGDPFGGELRSRTAGMASEEELLVFLKDLGGQWGSRRRRRKIVDASGLGDKLPRGWKLLLAIKRKGGHAWVYVRRYISPTETRKAVFTYKGENNSHVVRWKFECQFCHKVFDERRRYNGHVGNHVKNYVKRAEEAPGRGNFRDDSDAKSGDGLSLGKSKMDALVEIAQNTMESNSSEEGHKQPVKNPPVKRRLNLSPTLSKRFTSAILSLMSSAEEDGGPDSVAKGEDEFSSADQRNDDLVAIEELRYDNDETQGFDFVTLAEPVPLAGPQIVTDAPVHFGSEDVILNMGVNPACQLTTTCVWCGEEFTHDAPNSELQSDSVGFMCSTCKAKISGQINLLDSGSPASSHYI